MAGLTTAAECPTAIYAGDTVLFAISDGTYPATSWTLTYHWRATDGTAISWEGTNVSGSHLVSIAASATGSYVPQTYSGVAKVSNATQSATVWRGTMEVRDQLSSQSDNFDTRSWAKRCLDAIEEVIEGRASKDVLNTTIAGQAVGRMSPEQLFTLRDRFKSEYESELAQLAAEQGKSTGRNIVYRFHGATS